MSSLTVIGLGSMGAAIAHAFLKANIKLTVWNRTSTRPAVATLVAAGATFIPDISTAIAASPTTLFCVLSYDNINRFLSQFADDNRSEVLSGKTIINLTNGTPRQARAMSEKLHKSFGVSAYFDGGIMATPQLVGHEAAFVFVSGEDSESTFTKSSAAHIVRQIGTPQYISSDPGAAALYDLALLAGMYGLFAGAFTGMAMMSKQTNTPKVEGPVSKFMTPLLQYMVPYIGLSAKAFDEQDWSDHGNPMDMQRVAINNILQTCEEEGVDGGSLKYFADLMGQLVEKHGGDGGIAQIGTLMLKET